MKTLYTNEDMKTDVLEIIRQISNGTSFKPTVILGIARGGLIPAVMLSHWYNIPMYCFHCSLRDHKTENVDLEVLKLLKDQHVLIVDDICDGGHTLAKVSGYVNDWALETKTATLHYNINQKLFVPDFYGREKTENDWIEYSFEKWW